MGCVSPKELPEIQIALVGLGGSGKTTIAKQLKLLHEGLGGFGEAEIAIFKEILIYNVHQAFTILMTQLNQRKIEVEPYNRSFVDTFLSKSNEKDFFIDLEFVLSVRKLLNDLALKDFTNFGTELESQYNFEYLVQNLERFSEPDWIPNESDLLRVRQRTSGVTPTVFETKSPKARWKLLDAGGQRSEIRKWDRALAPARGFFFCASVNEFDMESEFPSKTSLQCSIEVFSLLVQKHSEEKIIFLFLNKIDLLKEKLEKLKDTFPEYKGGNDFDAAIRFISDLYLKSVKVRREVFIYPTCALDRFNMKSVFGEVSRHVIMKRLSVSQF